MNLEHKSLACTHTLLSALVAATSRGVAESADEQSARGGDTTENGGNIRRRTSRVLALAKTTAAIACAVSALWLVCRNASAGSYLADCLHRVEDPATSATTCIASTSKGNPTKCCKIDDNGNIDYDDCGGVVITKTGYWCVKGADYVGVHCDVNPDGNSETCVTRPPPPDNQYAPKCKHYITSASGLRVCADEEPGLPQGFYCCDKIENGQVDESSCSKVRSSTLDPDTGVSGFTCSSTLLVCAPESALVTWCTAL